MVNMSTRVENEVRVRLRSALTFEELLSTCLDSLGEDGSLKFARGTLRPDNQADEI